jgi:glucosyl-3-phosphoglycerate synthase
VTEGDETRSYRAQQWTVPQLVRKKGPARVSVVLPARDEAATVGGIVQRLLADLADLACGVPLIDELVVIDSDSDDDTAAVATAAGARVVAASSIRPDWGAYPGKGEALWKSLFVTTGDLLVFVDADLTEWGPHFVTGLLGPLLSDPTLMLVKGHYHRHFDSVTAAQTGDVGGRVTELVARPMLALNWPELAFVVQPLAGEWAIRREAVELLSMPVGYGVDLAALIDTAAVFGADTIAQVDLGSRAHRHHGHLELGAMALQVMAAAEGRLFGTAPREESVPLTQFVRGPHGPKPRTRQVLVAERPPAASVEGYRTR